MKSLTESLDRKIDYWYRQHRGWFDVAHDYAMADRCWAVAKWFESKREQRLKAIFGS